MARRYSKYTEMVKRRLKDAQDAHIQPVDKRKIQTNGRFHTWPEIRATDENEKLSFKQAHSFTVFPVKKKNKHTHLPYFL